MPVFSSLSGTVIRCFKRVEAFADWITGAAGPFFVFFCWVLIGSGGILFFDVVARDLNIFALLVLSPILILVPLNLYTHYYLVTHVPPGHPAPRASGPDRNVKWIIHDPKSIWSAERWGFRRRVRLPLSQGAAGDTGYSRNGGQGEAGRRVKRCRKCDGPKPERTHHCSVCKRCVLQMDHHCPWINNCVGLHNQRHFVLFMAWLSLACLVLCTLGFQRFIDTFRYSAEWPAYSPQLAFTMIWVLAAAIGFAVGVLCAWHLYMVSKGETSIESHDNDYLANKAKREGLIYLNPYDLGRRRNLELFFNIGLGGYSPYTLLFPFLIPPSSNGWSYPRRSLPPPQHPCPPDAASNLHAPELGEGLLARSNVGGGEGLGLGLDLTGSGAGTGTGGGTGGGGEEGYGGGGNGGYVMGDDGSLTDDDEGGGGWMDY
ncbi:hypothetical protein I350_04407 [Cryptococcus amylolentus CBS 6273]|nr:hypothetical protein I350_04407 [Cryptococcus amylolentus CBS 6273]